MAGLKAATGDYIALIDSDNILTDKHWLEEMIEPLEVNASAVCSEPISYTWRQEDGFISRYCALIGMNDPFVMFLGKYDRMNMLSGKWTEVAHKEEDLGKYLLIDLDKNGLPTIGANGAVFRRKFLQKFSEGNYLFDVDILAAAIEELGSVQVIKTKNGIVHTYCESSIGKFSKKQARRVRDFVYNKSMNRRKYAWFAKNNRQGYIKFILYCVLVLPLVIQAIQGYKKKRDTAWFFHPLACELTLFQYGLGTIVSFVKKAELDRQGWSQ